MRAPTRSLGCPRLSASRVVVNGVVVMPSSSRPFSSRKRVVDAGDHVEHAVVVRPHDEDRQEADDEGHVGRPVGEQLVPEGGLAGVRGRHVQGEDEQRGGDGEDAVRERLDAAGLVDLERRPPAVGGLRRWGRRRLVGARLGHGGVVGGAKHGPRILPDAAAIGVILRCRKTAAGRRPPRGRRRLPPTAAVRSLVDAGQGGTQMSDTARCPACGGALAATTAVCPACGFAVRGATARRAAAPGAALDTLFASSDGAVDGAGDGGSGGWAPSAPSPPSRVSAPSAVSAPPSQVSVDVLATRWSGRFTTRTARRATTTAALGIPAADASPGRPRVTPGGGTAGRHGGSAAPVGASSRTAAQVSGAGTPAGASRTAVGADALGARRARIHHRGGCASARAGARAAPRAQRSPHVGRRSGGRVRPGPRLRLSRRFRDLRRRSARPRIGHAPSAGAALGRRAARRRRADRIRSAAARRRRGGTTRSLRRRLPPPWAARRRASAPRGLRLAAIAVALADRRRRACRLPQRRDADRTRAGPRSYPGGDRRRADRGAARGRAGAPRTRSAPSWLSPGKQIAAARPAAAARAHALRVRLILWRDDASLDSHQSARARQRHRLRRRAEPLAQGAPQRRAPRRRRQGVAALDRRRSRPDRPMRSVA